MGCAPCMREVLGEGVEGVRCSVGLQFASCRSYMEASRPTALVTKVAIFRMELSSAAISDNLCMCMCVCVLRTRDKGRLTLLH